MFGIRQKLGLGFVSLLLILIGVGLLSRASLQRYSGTLERIFRENYDSVLYGQGMKDAIESLDDAVRNQLDGEPATVAVRECSARWEENLEKERGNITLAGERELEEEASRIWAGDGQAPGYRSLLASLTSDRLPLSERRALYRSQLRPATIRLKNLAQRIIDMNVRNMGFANSGVKRSAAAAERTLYTLIVAGVATGVVFMLLASRWILRPLAAVTESARQIERGNLDLIVPVGGNDELGQLAETFNRMATRLRELRRTDRARLVRTQRTTALALGSLPDGVAIVSPEGRIELANGTAERLFGLKPQALLAELPSPLLAELYRQAVTQRKAIEAKGYDSAIQVFNGQERFYLPTAVPILDEEKSLVGVTLVLADVTNLRQLDEMKSGLLSVVSHELKTPLTSIRMAAHLLLEERVGALTPKQSELLMAAKEDADRLYEIIEKLLDIGRIESGRSLIDMRPAPAERLVREAVESAMAAYREKGVALEADVPADAPAVLADVDRISHVFSNLLSNALKYTPSGGGVRIAVEPGDRSCAFAVSDTGIGIPEASLPRIFERFYRVPGQSGQTGIGLGLAIAREIVEAHGGSIRAESTPGAGSRFSFTLERADAGESKEPGGQTGTRNP